MRFSYTFITFAMTGTCDFATHIQGMRDVLFTGTTRSSCLKQWLFPKLYFSFSPPSPFILLIFTFFSIPSKYILKYKGNDNLVLQYYKFQMIHDSIPPILLHKLNH